MSFSLPFLKSIFDTVMVSATQILHVNPAGHFICEGSPSISGCIETKHTGVGFVVVVVVWLVGCFALVLDRSYTAQADLS